MISLGSNILPKSEVITLHTNRGRAETAFLVSALLFSFFFNGKCIYAFLGTVAFLMLALISVLYFAYQSKEKINLSDINIMMIIITIWMLISILWSRIPYLSIITSWWLVTPALACWIFVLTQQKKEVYKYFMGTVFVIGVLQSLVALYQFFIQETLPNGFFIYKNLLGSFLVLQIFVLSGLYFIFYKEKKRTSYALLLLIFFLAFVVGIIQSRGVYLSLFLSMSLFFVIAHNLKIARQSIITLFVTMVLAFICAEIVTMSGMSQRIMTLEQPFSAGTSRFLIWQGCLEMIRDYPFWGTGLGTYWLMWPPYRLPLDTSGGYFAHNDYIQLWIEGGFPLLMLVLILMSAIAMAFYKTMKSNEPSPAKKIEALSLFTGLLALAIHTFFDFNFYSMPSTILAGIMLGRLDKISTAKKWQLVLHERLKLGTVVYRICLLTMGFVIISFFIFIGLSNYYFEKGNKQFTKINFKDAYYNYSISNKLWTSYDRPLYMNASLLTTLVKPVVKNEEERQKNRQIYEQANEYLRQAEKLNPYRPQIYLSRGLLEEAIGAERKVVLEAFEKALQVDPLFFQGRTEYGRYLAQSGYSREALSLMEKGMIYYYYPGPDLIPYYSLTSVLRRQNGNEKGAKDLEEKILVIKEENRKKSSSKQLNWLF